MLERIVAVVTVCGAVSSAWWAYLDLTDRIHTEFRRLQGLVHAHEVQANDAIGSHARWIDLNCRNARREIRKHHRARGWPMADASWPCPDSHDLRDTEEE